MDAEREAWSKAAPSPTGTQGGPMGQAIDAGLERAGDFVKNAVDKTREKVTEYRTRGVDQLTEEVADYTRSQPVPALLMAAGVGVLVGMLLGMGRR